MKADDLSVLVFDGESDFAIFVLRCLAQVSNLHVHVLSSKPWVAARFSRHVDGFYVQPTGDGDGQRLDAISKAVRHSGARVILPVDEAEVQFISSHLPAVSELAAIPPVPDPDIFETLTNKWLLAEFLKENHIPGPETILYTGHQNFEKNLRELQPPLLIKPAKGRGGEGMAKFDNPGELLDSIRFLSKGYSHQFIVQSFVPGYDVDCSVLCESGKILAYTVQKGFISGYQCFAAPTGIEFIEDDQVVNVVSRLASAAKWSGIAHVDLRYDSREKEIKLVEVNARYWGSLLGSLVVGVNFPKLACLAALKVSFPIPRYRLGRYIAPWAAIKQSLLRLLQKSESGFAVGETGLPYSFADPVAEMIKLFRQVASK